MKQQFLTILVALCALAGMTNTAQAASREVTYTFIVEHDKSNTNRTTLTFTCNDESFGYSTGAKAVTIPDATSTTGFTVQLDDGLKLTYSQNEGRLTFYGYNSFYLNHSNDGGNSRLTLTSSHYYVTHVKMATTNGNVLTGQASPWMTASGPLDQDVDMVTETDGLRNYREFSASFTYAQVFGQLTVTYGDPRPYAITFNDAVNGQNGVTNTNPTSYNVATNDFQITAPTRTGYTLSSTTYTDGQHTNATAINLNMTPLRINRGDAVTRKDITFNTSWTAHQYTVHYNANGGEGSMDDQDFTYDAAQSLTANAFIRMDYVFNGWNTEADGSGTAYAAGQSVKNLTDTDGATVDLYAQWRPVAGSCGTNARWSYDDNGTLSITGTGRTNDFTSDNRPWEQYKDDITTVSIGDGITSIGELAFEECSNLASITGGNDLINVANNAFDWTQWYNGIFYNDIVNYLGHVAYLCGSGVSDDVTIADGTIAIAAYAFYSRCSITSVTIPASVTTINHDAFNDCTALTTVNVLADMPPTLGTKAFTLLNSHSLVRTFNVRNAAYKTANDWDGINSYSGTKMRVVSTIALPDGVTANAADGDKVSAYGTTYYAEGATVTLSGLGAEHTDGNFTYRSRVTVSYGNGQTLTADADANGQATFTMPDADATVTTEEYAYVKYIDASGTEQSCTDYTVVNSDYEFGDLNGDATLGVGDATERWYVIDGTINLDKLLYIAGNAHIILCDGSALRLNVNNNSVALYKLNQSLTIYGQAQGTGTLSVTSTGTAIDMRGDMTINGGTVTVTSTGYSGIDISHATLVQNGGTLSATGSGEGNAAIYGTQVIINGGTLTANGTNDAFGIYTNGYSTVFLGWTSASDRITVSSYYTGVNNYVILNQPFYDGTTTYRGSFDTYWIATLAGKTLIPYIEETFADDGTAILYDSDAGLPDDHKNADRIAALAADGQPHDIMLMGRTLYRDGDWNTLCLPFAVGDFAGTPLEGATVKELLTTSNLAANGTLTLNFTDASSIEAGKPYIVKWETTGDNITAPVFTDVTISSTEPTAVEFTGGSFVGQYSPFAINDDNKDEIIMLSSGNKLGYSNTNRTLRSFRCHFEVPGENHVRNFVLDFGDETTGVVSIDHSPLTIDHSADAWYDMQGRKLDNVPTKKGVYIYKGKKVKR